MEKLANIHPGEVLFNEFLEPLEITAYRLSKDLNIPQCNRKITIPDFRQLTMDDFRKIRMEHFRKIRMHDL